MTEPLAIRAATTPRPPPPPPHDPLPKPLTARMMLAFASSSMARGGVPGGSVAAGTCISSAAMGLRRSMWDRMLRSSGREAVQSGKGWEGDGGGGGGRGKRGGVGEGEGGQGRAGEGIFKEAEGKGEGRTRAGWGRGAGGRPVVGGLGGKVAGSRGG